MDSGDEDGGGASGGDGSSEGEAKSAAASPARGAGGRRGDGTPTSRSRSRGRGDAKSLSARVADVRSFSDMVRLAQALQRGALRMPPKEISAAVVACARVKFYDAEVFQSGLLPAARRHLQRSNGAFSADDAVDLVHGLAELNVYDKAIFSKIVEGFAERKQELEDALRRGRLLAAYKKAGHEGDKDFIEYLTQRHKMDQYAKRLSEQQGSSGPLIYYGGLRK